MTLSPEVSGTVPIRSAPAAFLQAFRQRVATGLLSGRPHRRSNYIVTDAGSDRLQIRAVDWWTAFNVGLNEVDLRVPQPGTASYHVRFRRWAMYSLILSAAIGLIALLLLLSMDIRGYIGQSPARRFPGLSADQSLLVLWIMVGFWALVWPWLLIALHKPVLRRLMTRLITEVDGRQP